MSVIFTASAVALAVLLGGSLPWSVLANWNQRVGVLLPWAIFPMGVYLWAYITFLGGRWGSGGAEDRRANLNAKPVPASTWLLALVAGALGMAAILSLLVVISRLVELPPGDAITAPPGMPAMTVATLLAMQSLVAGVTEESAFRGYMQTMVSRRFGVAVGVLAAGVLFGLLHFPNHPGHVLLMLPYYVAVSAMYGGLTWATGSILPAVVLHTLGDLVVLTRWWLTGLPEWQWTAVRSPLIWKSGVDAGFVIALAFAVVLCLVTMWVLWSVRQRCVFTDRIAWSS